MTGKSLAFTFLLIKAILSKDLFYDHLKKYIDESVHPCDNFYRHVCALNFVSSDEITQNFLPRSVLKSMKQPYDENETLAIGLNKCYQYLKDPFGETPGSLMGYLKAFIVGLKNRGFFLDYISKNNLLTTEFYDKMRGKMDLMMEIQKEQIEKTNTTQLSLISKGQFETWAETIQINIGTMSSGSITPNFPKIHDLLVDLYQSLESKSANSGEAATDMWTLILLLRRIDPDGYNLIASPIEFNSFNQPSINTLSILESALLVSTGTLAPAFWGSTGSVFGHEIQHSFFRDTTLHDSHLLEGRRCLQKFKKEICDNFGNETDATKYFQNGCYPSFVRGYCPCNENVKADTYVEDVADLEGFQLAYLSMVRDIGEENLQKKAYPDLKMTNQQLFYYASGALMCKESPNHSYRGSDEHSGFWMRSMMTIGLSRHFQEAFQCDESSKIARIYKKATDRCNQIGDSVR